MSELLVYQNRFLMLLGEFHLTFTALNLHIDCAIGKFLNLSAEQTHLLTAGLMFGPKARILADIVARSDNPKKSNILDTLNRIRGNSKREVIAHGYMWSDTKAVKFVERISSQKLTVKSHTFTFEEFKDHVEEFAKISNSFYKSLPIEDGEIAHFATAALSLERKKL